MRQDGGAEFISASLTLHLPDPVKWEVVQMDSYECILLLVFATGYILAVTKK